MKFADYKHLILTAIDNQSLEDRGIHESVTLINRFVKLHLLEDLGSDELRGILPTVGLVGDETGKLYLIALYSLIPRPE